MDYYAKYLKYKTKYLELKRQLGGGVQCGKERNCTKSCVDFGNGVKECMDLKKSGYFCFIDNECISKKCEPDKEGNKHCT